MWSQRRRLLFAVVLGVLAVGIVAAAAGSSGSRTAHPLDRNLLQAEGPASALPGARAASGAGRAPGIAKRSALPRPRVISKPTILRLHKARSAVFDVRRLKSTVVRCERPEVADRDAFEGQQAASPGSTGPGRAAPSLSAPAP